MCSGWAAYTSFNTTGRHESSAINCQCRGLYELHHGLWEGWALADGFAPSHPGGKSRLKFRYRCLPKSFSSYHWILYRNIYLYHFVSYVWLDVTLVTCLTQPDHKEQTMKGVCLGYTQWHQVNKEKYGTSCHAFWILLDYRLFPRRIFETGHVASERGEFQQLHEDLWEVQLLAGWKTNTENRDRFDRHNPKDMSLEDLMEGSNSTVCH